VKTSGSLVARALSGSWRSAPPPPALTVEEWREVAPTLHATAAGGLGWWKVQGCAADLPEVAPGFRDAFRIQTLDARLHERRLVQALEWFGAMGIQPILGKGWAVARLYPRPGLRPYGDLDLHVAPDEYDDAADLLPGCEEAGCRVDLHRGLPRVGRPWAEVVARGQEVELGATRVRVLGAEDHLALLCAHLLFHGAWRPLWLCDVALLVETAPAAFDWDYLAQLPAREVEQVRLVALLAHRLLGADLSRTPWPPEGGLPGWLPRATLRAWGRGGHYTLTTPLGLADGGAGGFLGRLRMRWPNPIEVTYRWRAPYGWLPRLPWQLLDVAARGVRALASAGRVRAEGLRADAP